MFREIAGLSIDQAYKYVLLVMPEIGARCKIMPPLPAIEDDDDHTPDAIAD